MNDRRKNPEDVFRFLKENNLPYNPHYKYKVKKDSSGSEFIVITRRKSVNPIVAN